MATSQLDKYDIPQPIQQAFDRVATDLKEMLGSPEVRDRFVSVVMSQIRLSEELQKASLESIMSAIFQMAKLRLDPALPNEVFLAAFKGEAQLIIGYAGLRKLVMNNPLVEDVWCQTVYENDVYEEQNINEPPRHRRPPGFNPRGKPIGYYAVARLRNGSHRVVAMSRQEIEAHKNKYSRSAQKSIWVNNFDGMALKTVMRMLCHPRELPMDYDAYAALDGERALYSVTPKQISEAAQQRRAIASSPQRTAMAVSNLGWGDDGVEVVHHKTLTQHTESVEPEYTPNPYAPGGERDETLLAMVQVCRNLEAHVGTPDPVYDLLTAVFHGRIQEPGALVKISAADRPRAHKLLSALVDKVLRAGWPDDLEAFVESERQALKEGVQTKEEEAAAVAEE